MEQDPTEVLASQIGVMMEVQFKSGIHSDRIAAIGISNQRETTVVWDRVSGQPIYNAIVWQCRRTAPAIDALVEQGCEELVRSRTGLTLDPYFSASKVQWILDNVDGARESAAAGDLMFGTIDTCSSTTSPAARSLPPTTPMPAARHSLISIRSIGTTTCWRSLTFHVP